jgi:hypothetical protein
VKLAALLLALWFGAHYAYMLAQPEHAATVFNIGRSASSFVLLLLVAFFIAPRWAQPVIAGFAADDAQVIACGTWWLVEPWSAKGELCSEAMGLPLGAFGITALAVVGIWLTEKME